MLITWEHFHSTNSVPDPINQRFTSKFGLIFTFAREFAGQANGLSRPYVDEGRY